MAASNTPEEGAADEFWAVFSAASSFACAWNPAPGIPAYARATARVPQWTHARGRRLRNGCSHFHTDAMGGHKIYLELMQVFLRMGVHTHARSVVSALLAVMLLKSPSHRSALFLFYSSPSGLHMRVS